MSKSDLVAAALREMIITGEFSAGEALRQRDLAARFGVSLTPIREALRRLESEGLVDYDVHRGAKVIETAASSAEDNYEVRAVLESFAAGLAAERVTAEELSELQDIHEQLKARPRRDDVAQELNRRFHFKIYEACRSPLLLALLRLLWTSFPDATRMTRPLEHSADQHGKLLEALARGSREDAERLAGEHIRTSFDAGRERVAAVGADTDDEHNT